MINFFTGLNPIFAALIAGCFTWGLTVLGAAFVFIGRTPSKKLLDGMLGFAAGVMIAASFWSLLAPAIEMSRAGGHISWLPAVVGFLLGGVFLRIIDRLIPHLRPDLPVRDAEGLKTKWHRSTLLVLAITLHNFPEGLVLGVAFGAAAYGLPAVTVAAALALTIGIGIQDVPEGLAVSMPLRREGLSRVKSFLLGALSGLAEPMAAVVGASAVLLSRQILPYAMAFSAGAMIFVAVEEVIPESQSSGNTDIATLGAMLGFAMMMVLDVGLS